MRVLLVDPPRANPLQPCSAPPSLAGLLAGRGGDPVGDLDLGAACDRRALTGNAVGASIEALECRVARGWAGRVGPGLAARLAVLRDPAFHGAFAVHGARVHPIRPGVARAVPG